MSEYHDKQNTINSTESAQPNEHKRINKIIKPTESTRTNQHNRTNTTEPTESPGKSTIETV
jgi:hypothetical protein